MEIVVTLHQSCYTISVRLSDRHRGVGAPGHRQHLDLVALRGVSALSRILPLAHVSVDYQATGVDLLRTWSPCPQTGACRTALFPLLFVLAELNPFGLSVSGISLTALDISMISRYIGNLTELMILPRSEFNPGSLRYLTHLRRLVVDATMCCFPSDDDSEEYYWEEMADALTELCRGPFGWGGHLTLQYTCEDEDDAEKGFCDLEMMEYLVKQRLRDGAQGEEPRVAIEVEWVPE